ncbi:MAG TPA: ABC transporter permease [Puia sp.]|nr:ABC transporter permease [Puia sp.]
MYKLRATIIKDIRTLTRDRIGLALMFGMPILLVIIITLIQNNTFELVSKNKSPLLLCNRDTGEASSELIQAIDKIGMFRLLEVSRDLSDKGITDRMHAKDALLAVVIPSDFSSDVSAKTRRLSSKALNTFGLKGDTITAGSGIADPVTLFYHPILQEPFRRSVQGALYSALQLVESRQLLKSIYFSINEKQLPDSLENDILSNKISINEVPVSRDGSRSVPNASQHNVPAWTIFAMFFVVLSLGSGVVREKLNGSFIRLKTLPTNYLVSILSKQVTYLGVTIAQAIVIFTIGVWLFPAMGLPALDLPSDLSGLALVSVLCGWCAVSYAICIGVFARTEEQANGFGAISIVMLAAIGGLMVPSFAMPDSFRTIMKISPLHWCLEAYYGLFLEGGKLKDVLPNLLPLFIIVLVLQFITFAGLKRKNLI